MDSDDFFNKNSHFYGSLKPKNYDYFFINFINNNSLRPKIVDIGGGGGTFAKLCQENTNAEKICIVDPSINLLHKQDLQGIDLVVGKLPDSLNINEKYDFIHIKEVLHHVVGSSVANSKKVLIESLISCKKNLNEDGFILINELYYESYIVPTLTRTLIFYLLKTQNRLNIKVPAKEFLMGLDVCFYTRKELREIFRHLDLDIIDYYEEKMDSNQKIKEKLLLINNWGSMCFVLKQNKS